MQAKLDEDNDESNSWYIQYLSWEMMIMITWVRTCGFHSDEFVSYRSWWQTASFSRVHWGDLYDGVAFAEWAVQRQASWKGMTKKAFLGKETAYVRAIRCLIRGVFGSAGEDRGLHMGLFLIPQVDALLEAHGAFWLVAKLSLPPGEQRRNGRSGQGTGGGLSSGKDGVLVAIYGVSGLWYARTLKKRRNELVALWLLTLNALASCVKCRASGGKLHVIVGPYIP